MTSRTRWLKRGLLTLLAICLVTPPLVLLYFMYLFDWNRAREPLGTRASGSIGRKIVINGDLRPDWGWPISRLEANGIEVDNMAEGSDPLMLQLDRLSVAVNLRTLLHGDLEFVTFELVKPRLLLEKTRDGKANWDFTANPAGGVATAMLPDERGEFPIIDHLLIEDGRLTYKDAKSKTDLAVSAATVKGAAEKDDQRIHFDGKGRLQGQPFAFNLTGGSVLNLRNASSPYPVSASLIAGATKAKVEGTVTDPVAMKGLDVNLSIQGDNAADLFPLTGIALLPTPPYKLDGRLRYEDKVWSFNKFAGHMGDSDLEGDLTWDVRPKRPHLKAVFTSRQLDLDDLSGFIGAQPDVDAGETASPEQQAAAVAADADTHLLPNVPLDISRLSAMDAEVDFKGLHVLTKTLRIDDFQARFELDNRLLKVNPVRFGSGKGDVALWLTINAREQPVQITSKAEVRRIALAGMLDKASERLGEANMTTGYIGGTADLAGVGKSLREMLGSSNGNIGIGMEGGQMSQLMIELVGLDVAESAGFFLVGDKPVPIRCVIADFAVTSGLMQPRALVIDTEDTIVTGEGEMNLHNESLALVFKPAPKDFSPLSLRAPLKVGGTLKHPEFGVAKGGLLARGAAAAVLGVLFPPAALLAFIDPGTGEDSQCKTLLSNMARQSSDPKENKLLTPDNPKAAAGPS